MMMKSCEVMLCINFTVYFICSLTHWKQDLLLIKDPILLEVGDVIKGHIKMSRHHIWRRHLRLELSYQVLKGRGGVVHQVKVLFNIKYYNCLI